MECKVSFVDIELKKTFEELEISDLRLYKEIDRAIRTICQNAFCGRNVKKELIPKEIKQKYNIDNLWIYNLSKNWRLIYSVGHDEIELISVVLDWMDHKDYDRLFGF